MDLDSPETALRERVKRAEIDGTNGPVGAQTTEDREERTRLRREAKRLQVERDILNQATAFFAKRNT